MAQPGSPNAHGWRPDSCHVWCADPAVGSSREALTYSKTKWSIMAHMVRTDLVFILSRPQTRRYEATGASVCSRGWVRRSLPPRIVNYDFCSHLCSHLPPHPPYKHQNHVFWMVRHQNERLGCNKSSFRYRHRCTRSAPTGFGRSPNFFFKPPPAPLLPEHRA